MADSTDPKKPAEKPEESKGAEKQKTPQVPEGQTAQKDENEKDNKKLTQKQKIVLVIVGIVLVCATIVAVVLLTRDKPEEEKTDSGIKIINEANVNEIMQEVEDKVAMGMFETHMNTTWKFPDGKSASSNAVMGNSQNNNYAFYFTVTLSDTGETIFTSGLLPVGTQIAEIVLEKELEAGTYDAAVNINMVDDDGEPVESNMGISLTIIVEN